MLKTNLKNNPLIPFIMTGDTSLNKTYETIEFYIENGIEVMEIGVPFSDPSADGKSIQAASVRALNIKTTILDSLKIIKDVKSKYPHVKIYLMSYLNPILKCDNKLLLESKVDGLIIPDMPVEEYSILDLDLPFIGLIPIGTTVDRIKKICAKSDEFIYLVSNIGTTGASELDYHSIIETLNDIRHVTDLPVSIGFGINSVEKANRFKENFDGIIIGSYFVDLCYQNNMDTIKEVIKKTVI